MIKTMFKAKKLLALVMAAFVLTAFVLTSCSSDGGSDDGPSVVATYNGTDTDGTPVSIKFNSDNTFSAYYQGQEAVKGTYSGNPAQDGAVSGALTQKKQGGNWISGNYPFSVTISGGSFSAQLPNMSGTATFTRQ